jgi:hypothetical protein
LTANNWANWLAVRALLFNQAARGAQQLITAGCRLVTSCNGARPPTARTFRGFAALGHFGRIELSPPSPTANLDDLVRGRVHVFSQHHGSLASTTVRWCFTAANRDMVMSARQGPQIGTYQRIVLSLSGHPTTASVGPAPQKVIDGLGLRQSLSAGVGFRRLAEGRAGAGDWTCGLMLFTRDPRKRASSKALPGH